MNIVLMQHTKTMIRMKKNGLNEALVKEFPLSEIIKCCERIEKNRLLNSEYKDNDIFQKELVRDDKFINYLNKVYEKELDINGFEILIKDIEQHNDKISNYPIDSVLDILSNRKLFYSACYSYLRYFTDYTNNSELKELITYNLNHFYEQSNVKFDDLSEKEIELLKSNSLDNYNLVPIENIKATYAMLVNNEELRNFIGFLNIKKMYIPLDIELYKKIADNAKEAMTLINKIIDKIPDNEITYQLLLKWLNNDCKIYDLRALESKVGGIDKEKLDKIANSKSEYINFIYGSKLKQFPLELIDEKMERLIIYAISNNKNRFLSLIENNIDTFLMIPNNSILYNKNLYEKYINLNELTYKHLIKLKAITNNAHYNIDYLQEQIYTLEEIMTLYNVKINYIKLYNNLLDLKIDERLLRIRQFIKKDLLREDYSDIQITNLAKQIKIKPLYSWLEQDFNTIKNIKVEDAVQILMNYDNVQKFISEIKNRNELSYVLRNIESITSYDSMEHIIKDIETIDRYWKYLKSEMNFSDEFVQKNIYNIKQFLLNNGAELAYKYYQTCTGEHKNSFKLIAKAEIMGEFKKLKYHTNDLNNEISYQLNDKQIKEWTENNLRITEGMYEIGEYDDFYHTMILGECPQHTCLSYINGMYNRCLLACFDSNKKILYAKVNGKIIGRAMIRLTKGAFSNMNNKKGLKFIDVEEDTQMYSTNNEKTGEQLTLFLEKPYMSYINEKEATSIEKLFIKIAAIKARQMNAILVLSHSYNRAIEEQFVSVWYYMYISKSKSSSQYLDSLDGQATISDEGQYKVNNFLIWKPNEDKKVNLVKK